ncbi:hypothetical protein AAG906_035885 [Vitis piasezkii]
MHLRLSRVPRDGKALTIKKPLGNARKRMCGGDDHLAWKHPVISCVVWIRRGLELEAPPHDSAQYDFAEPPPPSLTPIQASNDAHARMDRLEQRMRQMRVSDGAISWDDFDGALYNLSSHFRMPRLKVYGHRLP